ncbi:MAG: HAD-IA family hydrolase, partial [Alphaproteobacteria bacterium]|nr:HAD-IA family hydrolase [Alphaproteobacteria bacterium]
DMDDVLCRYDLGRRLRALSRLSGRTPRDIRAAIWDSGFEDDADSGGFPDSEHYLAEFNRRLGRDISLGEWIAARREAMTPNPEVLGIARLIAERAELTIYTNNGPIPRQYFAELFPEAARMFAVCHCSYEFATKKPDPASYVRLLARLGTAAGDTWFIDDKQSNVEGARLAGLAGHHFRSPALLAEAARELDLIA